MKVKSWGGGCASCYVCSYRAMNYYTHFSPQCCKTATWGFLGKICEGLFFLSMVKLSMRSLTHLDNRVLRPTHLLYISCLSFLNSGCTTWFSFAHQIFTLCHCRFFAKVTTFGIEQMHIWV